jgi:uncharacterized RDD family membrane protein YckC
MEFEPEGEPYAGFWIRFLASFIDGLILIVPNVVIGLVVEFPLATAIQIVIGLAYTIGFWVTESATPGKMAMGIVILKADGEVIDIGSALLRYLGYFASSITLGIGYLMIGFREDKRGLHDLIGGTVVIRKTHVEKYLRQIEVGPTPPAAG